jgi:transcriptional regulator with XRE-family HTH domain
METVASKKIQAETLSYDQFSILRRAGFRHEITSRMEVADIAMDKQPNEVDQHVGRRLRMRRLMLGMSQEKLAGQLQLTFQQVQKYEKGVNRISASRLQDLSRILQVPVPFFFEGAPGGSNAKGPPPTPAYVSEFLATADSFVLIRAFTRIKSAHLRRSIVRLVEGLSGAGDER